VDHVSHVSNTLNIKEITGSGTTSTNYNLSSWSQRGETVSSVKGENLDQVTGDFRDLTPCQIVETFVKWSQHCCQCQMESTLQSNGFLCIFSLILSMRSSVCFGRSGGLRGLSGFVNSFAVTLYVLAG